MRPSLRDALLYLLWPYRPILSSGHLIGGTINLAWNILMAIDRYGKMADIDAFGWFHQSFWFYTGLISIGWQIGLIQQAVNNEP